MPDDVLRQIIYYSTMSEALTYFGASNGGSFDLIADQYLPLPGKGCNLETLVTSIGAGESFSAWRAYSARAARDHNVIYTMLSSGDTACIDLDRACECVHHLPRCTYPSVLVRFLHSLNYPIAEDVMGDALQTVKGLVDIGPCSKAMCAAKLIKAYLDTGSSEVLYALAKLCNQEIINIHFSRVFTHSDTVDTVLDELTRPIMSASTKATSKQFSESVAKDLISLFDEGGVHALMAEVFRVVGCMPGVNVDGKVNEVFERTWQTLHKSS